MSYDSYVALQSGAPGCFFGRTRMRQLKESSVSSVVRTNYNNPRMFILRTGPFYRRATFHVTRSLTLSSQRTFISSARRFNTPAIQQGHAEAPASQQNRPTTASSSGALTRHDAVSTVPSMLRGDWVLFHPVYTPEELRAVEVLHREAKSIGDMVAYSLVRIARACFDLISGYKHKPIPPGSTMTLDELRKGGYVLDEHAWLSRILFLESIAAVPGMVAATLRHLTSLRLMKRDSGWIHTLLEEAENERMHLMTFLTLRKPSRFFRAIVLGAQGVVYNLFFLSYMISPRTCHRFVAYIEEEAVLTYTRCIEELEAGRLPKWSNEPAPDIAKDYWHLAPDAKLLDVIYAVRSDETTHRFVNHSLANLNVKTDVNPFAFREPDMHIKGKKLGFERSEAEKYVQDSRELLQQKSGMHSS